MGTIERHFDFETDVIIWRRMPGWKCGKKNWKRLFILDREIGEGAERLYRRVVTRRIRIRSLALALGGFGRLAGNRIYFYRKGMIRNSGFRKRRIRYGGGTE
jgi:hypothetical protein